MDFSIQGLEHALSWREKWVIKGNESCEGLWLTAGFGYQEECVGFEGPAIQRRSGVRSSYFSGSRATFPRDSLGFSAFTT